VWIGEGMKEKLEIEGCCVLEQNGENERFLDLFLVIVIFCYD
jgi:hypothetical protein